MTPSRITASENTLKNRLVRISRITQLSAFAIIVLIVLSSSFALNLLNLTSDSHLRGKVLAENSAAALIFNDRKAAAELLQPLRNMTAVQSVTIFLPDGAVFSHFQNDVQSQPGKFPASLVSAHAIGLRQIDVFEPIVFEGSTQGLINVRVRMAGLYWQLLWQALIVLGAASVALLLSRRLLDRLNSSVVNPLEALSALTIRVSSDSDYSLRAKASDIAEFQVLAQGFNAMLEQIEQRNTALSKELAERLRAERQLEHLAHHDPVTGLPNRHFFRSMTSDLTRSKALSEGSVALLFIDLDNFKYINDSFGHDCGDQLLMTVAERLLASVRANDVVVRFGGDEFVVLLYRIGDSSHATQVAQKLLASIKEPLKIGANEFTVTCSIGLAVVSGETDNVDSLLQKADAAMYVAKANGKNSICLWEPSISNNLTARYKLETDLRQALQRGEIELHYQPIVELATERITGMEALMRWRHPALGFISPVEFIPIAEDSGLILDLGTWAMREAFTQAARWNAQYGPLFMAVNVSARQFREKEFGAQAEAIAHASGLDRGMGTLEVTESILMVQGGDTVRMLTDLSARGFTLALDDFGTGYSSLSYLKRFPIDRLKIDRSFVKDLPHDLDDVAIVKAIIGLSQTLSMRAVAEGIETEAQAQMLRELGCQYGQGYHFSRPLSTEAMGAFIAANLSPNSA